MYSGGRRPSNVGREAFWRDKRVLVTGAAGSVGAALCARLAGIGCAGLGLLDQFDHGLIEAVEAIKRASPSVEVTELLSDVRDRGRLGARMAQFQPDVVIHAAALKHVHVGERHPGECALTNLVGVRNAIHAAADAGASEFVLVSTDKAAAPVCVMGAVKRLAELYLRGFEAERGAGMRLKAVRFGNVLGSQGSVAPRFAAQIAAGGPVELTHPDMRRYFMSSDEAVDLILAASSDAATRGAVYVMDMGPPVRIEDLAREMMEQAGTSVAINVVGLRPGEKLSEQLYDDDEHVRPSGLAGISIVTPLSSEAYVLSSDIDALEHIVRTMDDAIVRQRVFALLDARLARQEAQAG